MGNNHIVTTERLGLTVAQVGGNDIYKMRNQVLSIIESNKDLGDEYTRLFAEPVEGKQSIDWYAEDDSEAIKAVDLPPEEKQQLLRRFRAMYETLLAYAGEMRAPGKSQTYKIYADTLEKALIIPNLSYLYSVNGSPVLTGWGFSEGDKSVVEEGKSLIRQIEKTIAEEEAKAALLKQAAAAPAAPFPYGEKPAEEKPAESAPAEKAPAEPAPEEPPAEPAPEPAPVQKKKSKLPLILLVLALLAALALAAWFFFHKMEDTSFAFLQGNVDVKGVLANENNEIVDLRMQFPKKDGKGTSYIMEKEQTCEGKVEASHGTGDTVMFNLGELICPNNNNYDPFNLICIKGKPSCTGTNKNGESWHVEVTVGEGA